MSQLTTSTVTYRKPLLIDLDDQLPKMLKGVGSGYVGEAWGREVEGVILMSLRYDSIAF